MKKVTLVKWVKARVTNIKCFMDLNDEMCKLVPKKSKLSIEKMLLRRPKLKRSPLVVPVQVMNACVRFFFDDER